MSIWSSCHSRNLNQFGWFHLRYFKVEYFGWILPWNGEFSLKSKWQTMRKWSVNRYITATKHAHICRGPNLFLYPFLPPPISEIALGIRATGEGGCVFICVFLVCLWHRPKNQAKLNGKVTEKCPKQFWIITTWPKIEPAFLGSNDYSGDSNCNGN